jgi:hypothetical protein
MFLLFTGQIYYATGGAHNFHSSGADLDHLIGIAASLYTGAYKDGAEWWHIFDTDKLKIVAGSEEQAYGTDNFICTEKHHIIKIDSGE